MKALILAGGYGTRLGELTKDTPKPMLEVGGKPVIERIVEQLNIHGVHNIIVNIHYKDQVISDFLQNHVLYYYTPVLLGHFGTIQALAKWLKGDDFLVINGDTLTNLDYSAMLQAHQEDTITAAMDEYRCIGSWLYCGSFFGNQNQPIVPYRQDNIVWQDIGTVERLEKAREVFK